MQTYLERHRQEKERKLRVFRTLMSTRVRKAVDPKHTEALNLIAIEFYKDKPISRAASLYIDHLSSNSSVPSLQAWVEKGDDLLHELLYQMGTSLGYPEIDKVQIKRQGHSPILFLNYDNEQAQIRRRILDLFAGKISIPIHPVTPPNPNPPIGPNPHG